MGLEVYVKGYGVSFCSDENVLKFVAVTVAWFYKYTKNNYWVPYFKLVNFMHINFYLSKTVTKKKGRGNCYNQTHPDTKYKTQA